MKYLLPLILSAPLFAAPSGVYVEVYYDNPSSKNITTESASFKTQKGESGTVSLGYQMDQWRFEVESNYSKDALSAFNEKIESTKNMTSGDLQKMGGMANVYYSAYNETKLVSSIGLGVGATSVETKDLTIDDVAQKLNKKTSLTYQGSVSLGYMLSEDWTCTTKYKYVKMKDIQSDHSNYSIGLRYLF